MRTSRPSLWLFGLLLLVPGSPGAPAKGVRAEAANLKLAAPDAPSPFDPAEVRLPETSPERRMLVALEADDLEQALLIGEHALHAADASSRGRLLWLLERAAGGGDEGMAYLDALQQGDHPLARWARLRLAERLLLKQPERALQLAESLQAAWAGAYRARVAMALAHHQRGDAAAAEPMLRSLLRGANENYAAANLAMPLAELLVARGDRASLLEALELYRRVSSRAFDNDAGVQAEARAREVLSRLPPYARRQLARPSPKDDFARGEVLMRARQYDAARAVFDRVATRATRSLALRCKAQLLAGKALYYQRKRHFRQQAAKRLAGVARRCRDLEIRAWARYYAGSACQRAGEPEKAIVQYEALVRESSRHSLADDALFLQAFARQDLGDQDGMRKTLARQLRRFPEGDMRTEARFALAMEARARGELTEALGHLDRLLSEGPIERQEGIEGRTAYWRARTLQDLGRLAEAKSAYTELARALPLAYHSQQAIARLRELEPSTARALLAELQRETGAERLLFSWRVELETPSFRAALELLRVDEPDYAQRELRWLGSLGGRTDDELLWLGAAMLHEAGAYADASRLVRAKLRSFRETPPRGRARLLWRIAYPRAYAPLIETVAAEAEVPPEFVRAVAREESSFNPEAVSSALAYGLIQLIRPTARAHAAALGLPSDPAALKRPEINLRIGARFIRELFRKYTANPAVVPAAYNAGSGAADRWLREASDGALDEWIERIPYRETRRYTRRVLQTYGIYSFLDTGELPPLPRALPVPGS